MNKQDVQFYDDSLNKKVRKNTMLSPKYMVWYARKRDRLISPYSFETGTVKRDSTYTCYPNIHCHAFPELKLTQFLCSIVLIYIFK